MRKKTLLNFTYDYNGARLRDGRDERIGIFVPQGAGRDGDARYDAEHCEVLCIFGSVRSRGCLGSNGTHSPGIRYAPRRQVIFLPVKPSFCIIEFCIELC